MAKDQDALKKLVGYKAADMVKDGEVVGLGTGSTANFMITRLGERVKKDGLKIVGVPTSIASERLAIECGIKVITLAEVDYVDITIDGADEVDPNFDLIKGLGGALLREKVVAAATKHEVIIVDESKMVDVLGTKSPLPVEVIPFSVPLVKKRLAKLGCEPTLRVKDGKTFVTDQGNHILDCRFKRIDDPIATERAINMIPGVVENGLFIGIAKTVIIGKADGSVEVRNRK
jgi:ribose 5-phosphate isomerase A